MTDHDTTATWLFRFATDAAHTGGPQLDYYEIWSNSRDQWETPACAQDLVATALYEPWLVRCAHTWVAISGPGGTYQYPEPARVEPECGTTYWVPNPMEKGMVRHYLWHGDAMDYRLLARGQVHLDANDAYAHAQASIRAQGYNV